MSEEEADWAREEFEPQFEAKPTDKWAGEDEEDDVKDNWDDEEETQSKSGGEENEDAAKAFQVKKKKALAERIAEKEAKRKAAEEKRRQEEEAKQPLTPQQEEEEKLRQQKLQEDADLQLAKEAFGVSNDMGIDAMHPTTKEDFETFSNALRDKITEYQKSEHYVSFLEILYRDLAINLEAEDLKTLGSSLTSLGTEKAKVQKAAKGGKKPKKKATLNSGKGSAIMDDFGDGGDYDLYDDFM